MLFPLQATQGMPGWHQGSWGYHGDDGKVSRNMALVFLYGPMYNSRDTYWMLAGIKALGAYSLPRMDNSLISQFVILQDIPLTSVI
jgi:hypothetical protein